MMSEGPSDDCDQQKKKKKCNAPNERPTVVIQGHDSPMQCQCTALCKILFFPPTTKRKEVNVGHIDFDYTTPYFFFFPPLLTFEERHHHHQRRRTTKSRKMLSSFFSFRRVVVNCWRKKRKKQANHDIEYYVYYVHQSQRPKSRAIKLEDIWTNTKTIPECKSSKLVHSLLLLLAFLLSLLTSQVLLVTKSRCRFF